MRYHLAATGFTLLTVLGCEAWAQSDEPASEKRLDPIKVSGDRLPSAASAQSISIERIGLDSLSRSDISLASDLSQISASLTHRSIFGSSAPQFFIRGVGSNDINPSANPGIAIYQDSTFIASPLGQNLSLFDVAAVDILKGPQGTLFGRNATGGAIIVETRAPGDTPGGYLRLGAGEFGFLETQAAFDTGSAGGFKARLAGFARHSDGFVDNTLTGDKENDIEAQGARLTVDAELTGPWSARFLTDWVRDRSGMTAHEGLGLFAPESLASPNGPTLCDQARARVGDCVNIFGHRYSDDPYSGAFDAADGEDLDAGGVSLTVRRDGPIQFKSVTAFRTADRDVREDTDASPLAIAQLSFLNQSKTFTQEVSLKGKTGRLAWTGGVFYLDQRLETRNLYDNLAELRAAGVPFNPDPAAFFAGPFRLEQAYQQDVKSAAVYGEADYAASEALTLTVGLRLTDETTEFETRTDFREALPDPVLSPPRGGETSDTNASWRLAASYAFSSDRTVFVQASRGFRASSFNGGALFPVDSVGPVEPEHVTALETGTKWRLSETLAAEGSVFAYRYDGLQNFTFVPDPPPTRQVLDSADAEILGVDASFDWRLPLGFGVRGSAVWLDATYSDFVDANGIDQSGNRLTASPELSSRLSINWNGQLGERLEPAASLGWTHRSEIFFDSANSPLLSSPAADLLDARLSLSDPRTGLSASVQISNVTDEAVIVDAINIGEYGLIQRTYGAPRQVRVQVSKHF